MKCQDQLFPEKDVNAERKLQRELKRFQEKERLVKRKTEDEKTVNERLSWAHKEIEASAAYQYLIVNRDLTIAYQVLKSIVIAEEHRISKKMNEREDK